MLNNHVKKALLRDAFREVWKEIGNPPTNICTVLVNANSSIAEYIGFDMHYMSVLFVSGKIMDEDVGIAVDHGWGPEESATIATAFAAAWKGKMS